MKKCVLLLFAVSTSFANSDIKSSSPESSAPPLRVYQSPLCQNWSQYFDRQNRMFYGCFSNPWITLVADGADVQRSLDEAYRRIEALEQKIKELQSR